MPDWLWQNLVSSAIYGAIAVLCGVAIAWLRSKQSKLASPILYGLGAAALAALILLSIRGIAFFAAFPINRSQQTVTRDNIKDNVRKWLEAAGMGATQVYDEPGDIFEFDVLGTGSHDFYIDSPKDRPGFLRISENLIFSQGDVIRLSNLPRVQAARLDAAVAVNLAMARINYSMNLPTKISVWTYIPISPTMTSYDLMTGVDHVWGALPIVEATIDANVAQ